MTSVFLDTNVLLRHVLADNVDQSPRATAYFERIARGEQSVRISDTVVFETVFTLEKRYRLPRRDIVRVVWPLLTLTGVILPGKHHYRVVFDLYVDRPSLSFADCYHAMLMKRLRLTEIVSFDRGFDRVLGISRTEP
ncbi:MAG TPA: PIN domain-containing protein [Thermomicrobiales bacterium]|jgi:predicted nucleic acid-binding protein